MQEQWLVRYFAVTASAGRAGLPLMLSTGDFIHRLEIFHLFLLEILGVLFLFQFFEHLDLPVGFHKGLPPPFGFLNHLLQLLFKLSRLGSNEQFVPVFFQQSIDVDLARLARYPQVDSQVVDLTLQIRQLAAQDILGLPGFRKLFATLIPFGTANSQHRFKAKLKTNEKISSSERKG